jgi:hypothetical protein
MRREDVVRLIERHLRDKDNRTANPNRSDRPGVSLRASVCLCVCMSVYERAIVCVIVFVIALRYARVFECVRSC